MRLDKYQANNEIEQSHEKYTLDNTTIEAITNLPAMSGKLKEFPWPLELQGSGKTYEDEKKMLVRYPQGDIFLSYTTTIHELGHLRQEELNPTLKADPQTHEALLAQEQDAWMRGWLRFSESNPDVMHTLNEKFRTYHAEGKIDFDSFQELYNWVSRNVLQIVEAQKILFENPNNDEKEPSEEELDRVAGELEKIDVRDFLSRFAKARVGEIVDNHEIQTTIKKTVELIIME